MKKSLSIDSGAKLIIFSVVFLIAIILLLIPNLSRSNEQLLIGDESYYFLRIAENPSMQIDDLSYSGRVHVFNAWPLILNYTSNIFNISLTTASKVLPFIFGILSLLTFILILRKLEVDIRTTLFSSLILIFSPTFIYLSSVSNQSIIPIFLMLTSFLLLLKNWKYLAYLLLILVPFFGAFPGFLATLLLLFYTIKYKDLKALIVVAMLFFMTIAYVGFYGTPEILSIDNNLSMFQNLFSDLGGIFGISIFSAFLVYFGLTMLWEKKYKNLSIYLLFLFFLVLTFINLNTIFYFNFLISVLAAAGFVKLLDLKWETNLIKYLSLAILSLGIIFSLFSFLSTLDELDPDKEIIDALLFLKEQPNGVVFSHHSKGFWINSIAEKPNFIDSNHAYYSNLDERLIDSSSLFYTRDLAQALDIIEEYNLKYILIDEEMKSGQVWNQKEEGLLFLLEFSKRFKRIYLMNNIEIYEIVE